MTGGYYIFWKLSIKHFLSCSIIVLDHHCRYQNAGSTIDNFIKCYILHSYKYTSKPLWLVGLHCRWSSSNFGLTIVMNIFCLILFFLLKINENSYGMHVSDCYNCIIYKLSLDFTGNKPLDLQKCIILLIVVTLI